MYNVTDCVDRFPRTIPFWIGLVIIFNFTFDKFFAPIAGLADFEKFQILEAQGSARAAIWIVT